MRRNFHFLGEFEDGELIEHDRDEVRQCLLDLEGALYRLGGILTVSSVRRQVGPDQFVTIGMAVAYDSYTPSQTKAAGARPRGARARGRGCPSPQLVTPMTCWSSTSSAPTSR